eukprot:gene2991-3163_t
MSSFSGVRGSSSTLIPSPAKRVRVTPIATTVHCATLCCDRGALWDTRMTRQQVSGISSGRRTHKRGHPALC